MSKYFRITTEALLSPRSLLRQASPAARLLWLQCAAWAEEQQTDHIPLDVVAEEAHTLGVLSAVALESVSAELVNHELWEWLDDGYRMIDEGIRAASDTDK